MDLNLANISDEAGAPDDLQPEFVVNDRVRLWKNVEGKGEYHDGVVIEMSQMLSWTNESKLNFLIAYDQGAQQWHQAGSVRMERLPDRETRAVKASRPFHVVQDSQCARKVRRKALPLGFWTISLR